LDNFLDKVLKYNPKENKKNPTQKKNKSSGSKGNKKDGSAKEDP